MQLIEVVGDLPQTPIGSVDRDELERRLSRTPSEISRQARISAGVAPRSLASAYSTTAHASRSSQTAGSLSRASFARARAEACTRSAWKRASR